MRVTSCSFLSACRSRLSVGAMRGMSHVWIMTGSYSKHARGMCRFMFRRNWLGPGWVMCGSSVSHVRLMIESCLGHVCVMRLFCAWLLWPQTSFNLCGFGLQMLSVDRRLLTRRRNFKRNSTCVHLYILWIYKYTYLCLFMFVGGFRQIIAWEHVCQASILIPQTASQTSA